MDAKVGDWVVTPRIGKPVEVQALWLTALGLASRHDALWQEVEILRARVLHSGIEDPNLRAWSQGAVGDKSLQEVVGEFEELLIRRIWEHEGRKVSRVAHKLAVSPKKVRRVLRHLGLLTDQTAL